MSALDATPDPGFGLRTGQGVAPTEPEPGGDVFGAAFRQSNSVVSAIQYMRNSDSYTPVPDYNPLDDIKGWKQPSYFLDHGDKFVGSQSPAETYAIKDQIDQEETDRKTLAANGKIGFVAQTMAGMLDPTMLLPGGVGIDAAKGGLSFTKAAIETGKAGLMATTAQEVLLHGSQQTRTFEESALNVASGTLLSALIGAGATAVLKPGERAVAEAKLHADRADMNAHAGNPGTGEAPPSDIVAFHGSPYDFGRFDPEKIGSGEGRQTEGHGFYFGDNPEVAKYYAKKNAGQQQGLQFDALTPEENAAFPRKLDTRFFNDSMNGDTVRDILKNTREQFENELQRDPGNSGFKQGIAAIDKIEASGNFGITEPKGNVYQVKLKAAKEDFVDLRRPIDEQPAAARPILEKVGGDIETALSENPKLAQELQDAGVHGVIYGDGHDNFVVFDPKRIEITHKNGVPVAAASAHPIGQAGLVGKGIDAADRVKRMWAAESPIKSAGDLFAGAEANQAALGSSAEAIAADLGVQFKNPGIKGRARTQEKIDQGKAPGRINDVVRGGFVIDKPEQADVIVSRLAQKFETVDEGWAETFTGYFDRKVLVRFPNGQVGEVQIWHPEMLAAKRAGGHKLYAEWRSLATDDPRRAELAAEQSRIYSAASANLPPEWKALLGKGGSEGNLDRNASLDSTLPSIPISASLPRDHLPSEQTQASPGAHTTASPSSEPNLRGGEDIGTSGPTIGAPGAKSIGAAASDTRQLQLVDFGLNQIPGVRRVVEKTSPMQRVFGADSPTARRTGADLAETSLLFKQNLEGGVTTAGPALDREARLMIHQGQVAVGDELSKLFSEYRYGEQVRAPRARDTLQGITGQRPEGKMSFDEFKEAVSDAMRNGDQHENVQVQQAAQQIRQKIFEPWKKRAIDAGLLPEDVGVKTADSYLSRLYNKQAIAAKRPEFVDRVTDWLQADQQAKAEAQTKIGAYHGALQSHEATIGKINDKITKLEADADVIAARQEETTRLNKAANQRATKLREGAQDTLPLKNAQGGAVFETLARNRGNLLADRASAKLAEIETLEQKLATESASRDSMRAKIEEEIGKWEGKSTTEARAALKARSEAEQARAAAMAAGTSKSKGERLGSADKAVDRAVASILESDRTLSRDELRSRAHEITDRIIGAPDGRLPYDLGMEHGTAFGGSGEAPRGALAAREFNIPDATIKDFLENDIEHIIATHLKTMVPDVLLTEKFGDTRMTEAFRKINDEYAAMTDAAKSEKERTRLEKERQGVIDDLAAIRDRIRGTYAMSPELPLRNAARAANVLKNYNVLTSMGSAALSSLPDMAGTVLRHGLTSTFSDAWSPFFSFLTRQSDAWQEAGRQYRAMGIAVESVLASRHHALTDTLDTYHPQSRVERTMQWATGKFQFVNMLAPWTDFAKINASMVAGSELLRATKAAAEGKASARMLRTLGESGVEPHMAERIAKAFETGGEIRDGVHLPNTADWTDAEARRVFEGAVARDVDIAVVTPGQEKPLWMSHPLLSVLGQFKSFTAAATERVLISNLQRRDAQVLQGMIFSMGLGMLSYKLNSLTGGQPTSDKPQDWIKEAISRGNLLGWAEEANALSSKVTRGGVDIYRMIGADKPLSRYASRSAMDQILGPTAGKIGGILSVGSAISKPSEWNESDSKALRRLVAAQNVFWLRNVFDQVEKSGNNAFGIEMKAKTENR